MCKFAPITQQCPDVFGEKFTNFTPVAQGHSSGRLRAHCGAEQQLAHWFEQFVCQASSEDTWHQLASSRSRSTSMCVAFVCVGQSLCSVV